VQGVLSIFEKSFVLGRADEPGWGPTLPPVLRRMKMKMKMIEWDAKRYIVRTFEKISRGIELGLESICK